MRWRLIVFMTCGMASAVFWFTAGDLWALAPLEAVVCMAAGTLSGLLAISFAQDDGRAERGE